MKKLIRTISQAAVLMAICPALTQAVTLSDIPLFLTAPVAPNIIMTLDDSGSMGSAFVPDALYSYRTTKRFASSDYNSLYYNPTVTYTIPAWKDGTTYSTSFTSARLNGFDAGRGTINLNTSYKVTIDYYNDQNSVAVSNATSTVGTAYYFRYQPTVTGCSPANNTNDSCYTKATVGGAGDVTPGTIAQQQQNFANWYSFYRTRALSVISGAMSAVGQIDDNQARLAWQSINCSSSSGATPSGYYTCCNSLTSGTCRGYQNISYTYSSGNRIRTLDTSHRNDFYKWVQRFSSDGWTPMRTAVERAGDLYKTSGVNSPYADDPQVTDGTELACRKNFHILMTDGVWNTPGETGFVAHGNQDNTSKSLPDGTSYSPVAPYKDGNSDSLADIAFYYWSNDLRPDLADKVPPYTADSSGSASYQYWNAKNDPATWQHMVNFTMGLGLTSTMVDPVWGGSTYAGDYPALAAGTKTWPATGSDFSPGNVYDLWHAAIDSRGQFFSVEDPTSMTTAFRTILNAINTNVAAAAGLATNASSILTDSLLFQARFVPSDWSGQLLAIPILSGGALGTTPAWDAGTKMGSRDTSKIFTNSGTAGIQFKWTSLSGAQQALLNKNILGVTDSLGSDRVNWILGSATKEVRNGGTFRNRTKTVLGDIVNSDVAYTRNENYGYSSTAFKAVATEGSTYDAYITYKSGKSSGTVFVGANDGMLHAFNADPASGGNELFAYIPNAVMGKLSALTDPGYAHQYYVDGSPGLADAYFGGGWKTALVSGLGKGGQAVFALDITNPTTFGAGNVLWEKTPSSAGYANLGYVYSKPKIGRLNSGQWVAVFGNGYNSATGAASLYVVDVATGTVISEIVVDSGSGGPNGLSEPALVDTNGDHVIDEAYAGDLKGNMWKFNLTAMTSPYKLFTATSSGGVAQPITAAPTYGPSPDASVGGLMVYFGTGEYLGAPDVADTSVQSFYGIWDKGAAVAGRSALQQQSITGEKTTADGYQIRETSNNAVTYTGTSPQLGWYMDFNYGTAGERIVRKPSLALGWLLFTSVIPKNDQCDAGGDSWLYVLTPLDGQRPATKAIDVNNDGKWDASDEYSSTSNPSAVKSKIGILSSPLVVGHSSSDTSWDAFTDMLGGMGTSATAGSGTGSIFTSGSTASVGDTGLQPPPGGPPPCPTCSGGPASVQRTYWMQIQ